MKEAEEGTAPFVDESTKGAPPTDWLRHPRHSIAAERGKSSGGSSMTNCNEGLRKYSTQIAVRIVISPPTTTLIAVPIAGILAQYDATREVWCATASVHLRGEWCTLSRLY